MEATVATEATAATVFHLAEHTRDQEWRYCALVESEAEAEGEREVGENFEEVKRRDNKGFKNFDATSVDACKIPKPVKIIYAGYVLSLCLSLVEFLCAQVSCKIQNPGIR